MSWSVSSQGGIAEVKAEIERQFSYPLAKPPAGLSDEGERETVRRICETIAQILETFDPKNRVSVAAHGHIGWDDYANRTGTHQRVNVTIERI
jgi:hypothetical protein